MDALLLGGESPRHQQWVRDVAESLRPRFETVKYLDYQHWATDNATINLELEVRRAARLAAELESYVVVAKSIGTVVAALAVGHNLLRPEKCVFLGFPLDLVIDRLPDVERSLGDLPCTDFVQNEFDKVGAAEALRQYLEEIEPSEYRFRSVTGNATHDYIDMDLIIQLATEK